MRLDKFVCKSTDLSRSEAVANIVAGAVVVNDEVVVEPRTQVHEDNQITLNGQPLQARPFRYLLIHKPAATVCSNIDEAYPSIFNCLNGDIDRVSELHVAGRLDADTTGLVLATDDGRWSFNIIRPDQYCEKTYRVGLSQPLGGEVASLFQQGILLQGESKVTLPARLEVIHSREVLLTIVEGRYHQVKRMFAAVGNRVISLHRERVGGISLDVELSCWRNLCEDEISVFRKPSELS